MKTKPEISDSDYKLTRRLMLQGNRGWFTGDRESFSYSAMEDVIGRTCPELAIRLWFSKDKAHHSVGWWRNAEYEYCLHLSLSAWDRADIRPGGSPSDGNADPEYVPKEEERYWAHAFFGEHVNKLWHEPGGTDPSLTPEQKERHKHYIHLRLFLEPETLEPFVPEGEVYTLTRWVPGLTPDKVDR